MFPLHLECKLSQYFLIYLTIYIYNCSSLINQFIEGRGSNGEDIWRSTSDFIPIQSASFGTIKIGRIMSMEFDWIWWGRTNDPSLNKYEMFFRVGFNGSLGNGFDGQGSRYPSFWLTNNSPTMHLSVSDGSTSSPSYNLGAYGNITKGIIYHIKIYFNDTHLQCDIKGGGNPHWNMIWNRDATKTQYIGKEARVWWMSDKYGNIPYNRGNGTFSNITIISKIFGPTINPTIEPTNDPISDPTYTPTVYPTNVPSIDPIYTTTTSIIRIDPTSDLRTGPTVEIVISLEKNSTNITEEIIKIKDILETIYVDFEYKLEIDVIEKDDEIELRITIIFKGIEGTVINEKEVEDTLSDIYGDENVDVTVTTSNHTINDESYREIMLIAGILAFFCIIIGVIIMLVRCKKKRESKKKKKMNVNKMKTVSSFDSRSNINSHHIEMNNYSNDVIESDIINMNITPKPLQIQSASQSLVIYDDGDDVKQIDHNVISPEISDGEQGDIKEGPGINKMISYKSDYDEERKLSDIMETTGNEEMYDDKGNETKKGDENDMVIVGNDEFIVVGDEEMKTKGEIENIEEDEFIIQEDQDMVTSGDM